MRNSGVWMVVLCLILFVVSAPAARRFLLEDRCADRGGVMREGVCKSEALAPGITP